MGDEPLPPAGSIGVCCAHKVMVKEGLSLSLHQNIKKQWYNEVFNMYHTCLSIYSSYVICVCIIYIYICTCICRYIYIYTWIVWANTHTIKRRQVILVALRYF
jgi:hypothetical protein